MQERGNHQRHDQPENRDGHARRRCYQNRLRAKQGREIRSDEECRRSQIAEYDDHRDPDDDELERLQSAPGVHPAHVRRLGAGRRAETLLGDRLFVDLRTDPCIDDPAAREDQHASADHDRLLVVSTRTRRFASVAAAWAMWRNTVCRGPVSTPWVGSLGKTSFGARRSHFAYKIFCWSPPLMTPIIGRTAILRVSLPCATRRRPQPPRQSQVLYLLDADGRSGVFATFA